MFEIDIVHCEKDKISVYIVTFRTKNAGPNGPADAAKGLFLHGSADGAVLGTSAAAHALLRIDNILAITLGDRFAGAVCRASAARDASISDLISHGSTSL